jgi:hypothetical protein
MPRYYGLTNNDAKGDWPKNHAEIHAITHYLFSKSTPPAEFVDPPAKGDAARGKELFFQKGLHGLPRPQGIRTGTFPESVRDYAKADYGPNLSNIAAKFQSQAQGYRWLANWIKAPEAYHPKSLMPNVQLSFQDSADIASWILSVPGEWPGAGHDPGRRLRRGQGRARRAGQALRHQGGHHPGGQAGRGPARRDRQLREDEALAGREADVHRRADHQPARLLRVPQHRGASRTPSRSGPRSTVGDSRVPTKLDYGHIAEYLQDQPVDDKGARDGTDPYYQEKLAEHTRSGFLYEKLHRPRSYDYKKTNEDLKAWDERLRMPQFSWANDPAAIEEVMTFVLGLTGEKIPRQVSPEVVRHAERDGGGAGGQAPESVQLHGVPRPRDAQVHDRAGHQTSRTC